VVGGRCQRHLAGKRPTVAKSCETRAMEISVRRLVIDCSDPVALATFWSEALRCPLVRTIAGPHVRLPEGNQPHEILFQRVSDEKQAKNRLHLDLNPGAGTLASEVRRLEGIGARIVAKYRKGSTGLGWVVMADPEGNEFCVESGDREVAYGEWRLDGTGFMPEGAVPPEPFDWSGSANSGVSQSATVVQKD
jgi:hypothetical protein